MSSLILRPMNGTGGKRRIDSLITQSKYVNLFKSSIEMDCELSNNIYF
jgi:hypothetical protein